MTAFTVLLQRLMEIDPVVECRGRWFTVCCDNEGFEDDGEFHSENCPFAELRAWMRLNA